MVMARRAGGRAAWLDCWLSAERGGALACAPVNFTCRNWVTEVSVSCQNELASIMPNRAYYEISAV
jgi:hypothetical protein